MRTGEVQQFCCVGWTDYNAQTIRITKKAFLLHSLMLRGVMLHEVTHAQFAKRDITYDYSVYPSQSHNRLAGLAGDDEIENADNWRLFYQDAMRVLG